MKFLKFVGPLGGLALLVLLSASIGARMTIDQWAGRQDRIEQKLDSVLVNCRVEDTQHMVREIAYWHDKDNQRSVWEGFWKACLNVRYCREIGDKKLEPQWAKVREEWRPFLRDTKSFNDEHRKRLYLAVDAIEMQESPANAGAMFRVDERMRVAIDKWDAEHPPEEGNRTASRAMFDAE